ncbi:MAG TPA: SDR family oxidoreductase [Ktedonobacteraceae bacterium]
MDNRHNGKVALVTGGSRGLGKGICKILAERGATVIVNYAYNSTDAEQTVAEIRSSGGNAFAAQANITEEAEVARLMEEIEKACGASVDILVNNATGPQPNISLVEITWNDYLDQLLFFVKAPLLLTQAVLPAMKSKGWGRIIHIGSEVVQMGNVNMGHYVTAKAAMLGMTRSWANEVGAWGITVNLVAPGWIPVERHVGANAADLERYQSGLSLGHVGVPDDIGSAVTFLASDEGRFITGQQLSVNGGNTFGI